MTRLLLIDGSNLVMRAAFGGEIAPAQAVPIATGLVERVARQVQASHLVVALDTVGVSWRKALFADYKANRTQDTTPWLAAADEAWRARGWFVASLVEFEADDVLATVAARAVVKYPVQVCSGDSDLLPLVARGVGIIKPLNGGKFEPVTPDQICAKYQIDRPGQLTDLKALVGESGDNIPGVPGIGPVRAAQLLHSYEHLDGVLAAGSSGKCKYSTVAAQHEATVRLAHRLVSLRYDVPFPPIAPRLCAFSN